MNEVRKNQPFIRSLYEKLLGPENGPEEIVEQPYSKYQIGKNN